MGNLKFEMINLIRLHCVSPGQEKQRAESRKHPSSQSFRLHCVSPGQASGKRKASGFAELRRDKESRKLVFLRVRA
jgi:hypothetical protein